MKNREFWGKLQELVSNTKKTSISFFILTLILGMGIAAVVNFISTSTIFAKSLYLGVTVAFVSIVTAWILFEPFFKFRFKYKFIEEFEEKKAKYILALHSQSKSWVKSTDGLIGIRLFEERKHTLLDERLFEFKPLFDAHYKKSRLSQFDPLEIKIPIELDTWIRKNLIENNSNPFKIGCCQKRSLKKMKLNIINKQLLIFYSMKFLEKKFPNLNKIEISEILKKSFMKGVFGEKINVGERKFKSVHFSSVFSSFEINRLNLDDNNKESPFFEENTDAKNYYYVESNEDRSDIKKNRKYYNFHFELISNEDGITNMILQVIVDKRIIPTDKSVLQIVNSIL